MQYLSLHAYYEEHDGDRASFLGSGAALDGFIADVIATADSVGARLGDPKKIKLSVDEWNVWYMADNPPIEALDDQGGKLSTAEAARAAEPVEHRNFTCTGTRTEVTLAPESWTVLRAQASAGAR